jgi:NAD(P)-dependent dehydrogenase (short-subunit alcohol dehydrogenase family)
VNVAGAHVTTWTFMPLLLKSADPRLIFVAGLGSFESCAKGEFPLPPLQPGWPKKTSFETVAYRCSKTALNMLMLDYHFKLQKDGVKVWAVGPGIVKTDLGDAADMDLPILKIAGDPSTSGQMLRSVIEGDRDADTGKIVKKDGGIVAF